MTSYLNILVIICVKILVTEGMSCCSAFYNEGQLKDKDTYPCRKNYVKSNNKNRLWYNVDCTGGEDGCYYRLQEYQFKGKPTGQIRSGCLSEASKQCMQRVPGVTLEYGGKCFKIDKPTSGKTEDMESCIEKPDGSGFLPKDDLKHIKVWSDTFTMCVCKGHDCNGPDGPMTLN